jgi:two-component system cell cycle response regulator DivK
MAVVLVVEDDAATRAVLEQVLGQPELSGLGPLRVIVVDDAPAALRAVAEAPPDLVLLDVRLPGESGLALCRRLRADPRCRSTRIVALSALPGPELAAQAAAAGCDAFVAKPFELDELLAVVRRWLTATGAR